MRRPNVRLSLDERLNAPYKIASLVAVAAQMGIGTDTVLAGTGLAPSDLQDPVTRISVRQFMRACRNALAAGAGPETAFLVGARMRISNYGMYGYALLCCETLREVARLAVRYHPLATPTVDIDFREDDTQAVWSLHGLVDLEAADPLYRFFLEMQFAIHVTLGTDLIGPSFRLDQVRARYPAPADPEVRALYLRHLGCEVGFGQPVNELRYARRLLDAPTTYRNPITVAMVSEVCERLLDQAQRDTGVAGQVYRMLMAVPGQFADMETVAARLNTTSRTLRRKLGLESTSYQQVLADVRCELAKQYLRETGLSTEDIADALGFSDAANFRHAFRRWTGRTVSSYRR